MACPTISLISHPSNSAPASFVRQHPAVDSGHHHGIGQGRNDVGCRLQQVQPRALARSSRPGAPGREIDVLTHA